MLWLAIENATGKMTVVSAPTRELAYHAWAIKVLGHDVDDTGNVDIELRPLGEQRGPLFGVALPRW